MSTLHSITFDTVLTNAGRLDNLDTQVWIDKPKLIVLMQNKHTMQWWHCNNANCVWCRQTPPQWTVHHSAATGSCKLMSILNLVRAAFHTYCSFPWCVCIVLLVLCLCIRAASNTGRCWGQACNRKEFQNTTAYLFGILPRYPKKAPRTYPKKTWSGVSAASAAGKCPTDRLCYGFWSVHILWQYGTDVCLVSIWCHHCCASILFIHCHRR